MNTTLSKFAVASVAAVAVLGSLSAFEGAEAANLGGYDFGVASDPGNFTPSPTGVDPGLQFSDFTSNGVTITNGIAGNPPAGGNRAISAQNWSDTLNLSKYFTFTINPLPTTQSFSLSSLSFDARRGGNGPESIQVRSSKDNYSASLGLFKNQVVNNGWSTLVTDLSGLGLLTEAVTFRIYGYDAKDVSGNGSQLSLDNVLVRGGVNPVPTPALLPGLIGMGVAAMRKRKAEAEDNTAA
jgi:hypothetical protein